MPTQRTDSQHDVPPSDGIYFTGTNDHGDEVSLRRPEPGEVLCGACTLHHSAPVYDLDDETFEQLAALAWAAEQLPAPEGMDPLSSEALYPASGEPGHDCSSSYPSPIWINHPAGQADSAHVVSLFEALEDLPADSRQLAFEAHLTALDDLYDHLMAAESLIDGDGTDDNLSAACLACLSEPESHAQVLGADVTIKTLDLTPVLRSYNRTFTLGTRRPTGPVSENP